MWGILVTGLASGARRNVSLDSVRGLAALSVLFGHAYGLVPNAPQHLGGQHHLADLLNPFLLIKATPLRVIINGHAAVMVFFVLSGFVLRSTFLSAREAYWPYFRQRLWEFFAEHLLDDRPRGADMAGRR